MKQNKRLEGTPYSVAPSARSFGRMKMRRSLLALSCLIVCGCSEIVQNELIGTWETETIESEWGPHIMTMTYTDRGIVKGHSSFPENGSLKVRGTYKIDGDTIITTIDGRTTETRFQINGNEMTQYFNDEVYHYKKK